MKEYRCQWCESKISEGSNIILISLSKLENGFTMLEEVCAYHQECWEEFMKEINQK